MKDHRGWVLPVKEVRGEDKEQLWQVVRGIDPGKWSFETLMKSSLIPE